jgi:hypothetical protein
VECRWARERFAGRGSGWHKTRRAGRSCGMDRSSGSCRFAGFIGLRRVGATDCVVAAKNFCHDFAIWRELCRQMKRLRNGCRADRPWRSGTNARLPRVTREGRTGWSVSPRKMRLVFANRGRATGVRVMSQLATSELFFRPKMRQLTWDSPAEMGPWDRNAKTGSPLRYLRRR